MQQLTRFIWCPLFSTSPHSAQFKPSTIFPINVIRSYKGNPRCWRQMRAHKKDCCLRVKEILQGHCFSWERPPLALCCPCLYLLSCRYLLPELKKVSVNCCNLPEQASRQQAKLQRQKAWSYSILLTAIEEKSDVYKVKKLNWEPSFPKCSIPSHRDYWAVVVGKGPCPLEPSCALLFNYNNFETDLFSTPGWAQFDVTLFGIISDTAPWTCTYWKWSVFSCCWGIQKWEQRKEAMSWYIMVMFYATRDKSNLLHIFSSF